MPAGKVEGHLYHTYAAALNVVLVLLWRVLKTLQRRVLQFIHGRAWFNRGGERRIRRGGGEEETKKYSSWFKGIDTIIGENSSGDYIYFSLSDTWSSGESPNFKARHLQQGFANRPDPSRGRDLCG